MSRPYDQQLDEKQKETLLKYIEERRTKVMVRLWLSAGIALLGIPLAFLDLQVLLNGGEAAALLPAVLPALSVLHPGFAVLRRYRRGRYRTGEIFVFWLIDVVILIITVVKHYGIHFGKGSDIDCVRNGNYFIESRPYGGKSSDTGRHPYYLYDKENTQYFCPVFLEWRDASPDSNLLCIILPNGRQYAFLDKSAEPEWWEKDPY